MNSKFINVFVNVVQIFDNSHIGLNKLILAL